MTLRSQYGTDVLISGWAHTRFGKLPDRTIESLIIEVAEGALESAGVEASDVDEIFLAHYNGGLVPLNFTSSLVLEASVGLFGVPATRVENACASGSAAVQQGVKSVMAGTARTVLVVGAEKMTDAGSAGIGEALLGGDYELAGGKSSTGFAGRFAEVATAYADRYGDPLDAMAKIAAKNHRNGVDNPYAHIRKDLGEKFCAEISDANPEVAAPLRRTDCSPVSDGAAAVVITSAAARSATAKNPAVRLSGFAQANDFLPQLKRDPVAFKGGVQAWNRALEMAGVTLDDVSFAEVHDCFTIAELIIYEVMGLTAPGEGRKAIEEGWVYRDGRLPVNVSGGLKAKGHPIAATGVSQHVMAAMQLAGTAGALQLPNASRAAVHNMGGLAVANYASVLESTV